jgi:signal transduction histidine kinase
MEDSSILRATRRSRTEDYNPGMDSVAATWRRLSSRSPFGFDVIFAVGLSVLILVEGVVIQDSNLGSNQSISPTVLLMTIPLAWRRRLPLLVFGIVVVGAVLSLEEAPYTGITTIMIAAYSVGAYARYRLLSLAVVVATGIVIVTVFHGTLPPIPDTAGPFLVLIPLWLVGNALRTRQRRAEASEDRAARLEQEQELTTQVALAAERGRIARELHDVVAHNVSVMVVQAGAARHVLAAAPEQANQALLAVEASGREAMTELRSLLGVMRDVDEDLALAPQPGLNQLQPLIRRVHDAGLAVELRTVGIPRHLPPGIDLAAYRIVQEALTNCLKYSGLAPTKVILDYRERELKIEVLDEGPAEPSHSSEALGRGLVGMRERVALYGGALEAGPRLERGYAVRAWLPTTDNGQ